MFSDTQFWRLVWKEYRVHRPLWLALLIATPLIQLGILGFLWVFDDHSSAADTANGLMAIGFISSVIYLLGCSATMFSVEHETGTFDFQRVLPANQPRVFWAKVSFAFVSGVVLNTALWLVTRGVFLAGVTSSSTWFGTYGLLYMAEVFAWSILASLLIRQPLWGVIGAIALQSLMMQIVLPYLTIGPNDLFNLLNEDRRFSLSRFAVLAVLIVADIVLGKHWFEDRLRLPRWRLGWKPDIVASYPSDAELPAYTGQRQIGWSRLLWLGWRDGRWLIGGLLAWYVFCVWKLNQSGEQQLIRIVTYFGGSLFCGLFAFAPDQWSGRYRFYTERGCSPRVMWISRQAIWLVPVLIMTAGVIGLCLRNAQWFSGNPSQESFEWAAAVIGPFVCYAAGQFAAMLFRTTAVAIAVGFILTVFGIMWSALMTGWLFPTWWSVGSLPVIGLFVTWLKANDWVEERSDRTARWRTVLGLGVPVVLLLVSTATYRVVQIPAVTLPREWDAPPQVLARLTPAEKETLAIYRRALAEIESGEDRVEMYAARHARVLKEHPDWTNNKVNAETVEGFHRDWWKQHAAVVPLLREAHKLTPVPLALLDAEPATRSDAWNPDRISKLPWLMVQQAEQSLRAGELDQTWDDIVIAFELQRRFDLRASLLAEPYSVGMGSAAEGYLFLTVAKWGRHKEQTRERVLKSLRKLEEIVIQPGDSRRKVHHELLEAQSMLNGDERWRRFIATNAQTNKHLDDETKFTWRIWSFFPWERWRADRAVRLQTWLALTRIDQLQTAVKWNVSLTDLLVPQTRSAALERIPARVPEIERIKLLAVHPFDLNFAGQNSAPGTMLRMTVMPRNLLWDRQPVAEYTFWPRANSFRATMLLLALAEFHREHERYPESLTELVPTYFAEAPRDVRTAGPFRYFPRGVSEDVTRGSKQGGDLEVVVSKNIPFLVTDTQNSQLRWRQLPDGSWKINDQLANPVELRAALRGYAIRIWPVEEP